MTNKEHSFDTTRWADDQIWKYHTWRLNPDAVRLKRNFEKDGSQKSTLDHMKLINGIGSEALTDKQIFAAMRNKLGFYPVKTVYFRSRNAEHIQLIADAYKYAFEENGVFAKPKTASNGRGTYHIKSQENLIKFLQATSKTDYIYILQECISMDEYRYFWYIDDNNIRWRGTYKKHKTKVEGNGKNNAALLLIKDQSIPLWRKTRTIFEKRKSLGTIPKKGEIYNASITGNWREGGYMSPVDRNSELTDQMDNILFTATGQLENLINSSLDRFVKEYEATPSARIRNVCYDIGLVKDQGKQTDNTTLSRKSMFLMEFQHPYSMAFFFLSGSAPLHKKIIALQTYDTMIWNENSIPSDKLS